MQIILILFIDLDRLQGRWCESEFGWTYSIIEISTNVSIDDALLA
jgi:hypothetical protein